MKDVIVQCAESLTAVQIRKETSLASVSSRLVNLQTSGANLVSLGEGRKKGSVRGRKRKLIRSDSSGATEFSLKTTLSHLQALYSKYKAALEGRRVSGTATKKKEEKKSEKKSEKKEEKKSEKKEEKKEEVRKAREEEVKEKNTVVLRRKEHTGSRLRVKEVELKRSSLPVERLVPSGVRVSGEWKSRSVDRRSTISLRSSARQAVKADKLQCQSLDQESNFKRSYTLPGRFRGKCAPGQSVLEKAAAFSQVTEGTGLAAPFGLHASSRARRPSLEGRDLETKKLESRRETEAREERVLAASKETVAKEQSSSSKTTVQTAVVKSVVAEREPAKRVSLVNIDATPKPAVTVSRSPSISPIPFTRVVSPSSAVLPLEQEPPPRVVSPDPGQARNQSNRSNRSSSRSKSPSSLSVATPSSLSTTSKQTRRSIQNLRIAGKVTKLKHVFDKQEEEEEEERAMSRPGEPGKKSPSTSPRRKVVERHPTPDIIPKVVTEVTDEASCIVSELLMAGKPLPNVTPETKSEPTAAATVKETVTKDANEGGKGGNSESLAPVLPEPPQNYAPSPEVDPLPPRPPSPIGYVLEENSDGESSYHSYDTEYSDEDESEGEEEEEVEGEEEEEEGEEEGEVDGGVEAVDSASISKRTVKTLQ